MSKHKKVKILQTDLLEHPAVKAWNDLGLNRDKPEAIIILQEKRKGKTAVYRLEGIGRGSTAIVAKRCRSRIAIKERSVYEKILPQLPISSLRYYGFIEEPGGEFCWQFLEDAGEQKYSHRLDGHHALSSQWLALMHVFTGRLTSIVHLPDRGAGHYLRCLRSACNRILANLANPAFDSDDVAVLEAILAHHVFLQCHWHQIEKFCDTIPRTLVHGDFTSKNLRVRASQNSIAFLPFDWEEAGWGIPAADLGSGSTVDILTYGSIVRQYWPGLDVQTLQMLKNVGRIFRCIAAIDWESQGLANQSDWVKGPMLNMRIYESRLTDAIEGAGWSS